MSYDLKITGGLLFTGDDAPPVYGDLGIRDGRIVAVGNAPDSASRTVDANGAAVTPGFIDPHTHYDAQVLWDSSLLTSICHGVTTAFMGNCGVGFAPLADGGKDSVISLMGGVEDIPPDVLETGLKWDWRSFPEYMDRLAEVERPIDIGAQVPHDALRLCVMGERGQNHEMATQQDIEQMRGLARDALKAGAYGFTFGRVNGHRTAAGIHTPSYSAGADELIGIAGVLSEFPHRVIQGVSDMGYLSGPEGFEPEFAILEGMMAASGSPISFNLLERPEPGADRIWRKLLDRASEIAPSGHMLRFQSAPHAGGVFFGLTGSANLLACYPSYRAISDLPLAERIAALRDPAFRDRLLAETPALLPGDAPRMAMPYQVICDIEAAAEKLFALERKPNYEPAPSDSIGARARAAGKSALAMTYDAMIEDDGCNLIFMPKFNYNSGNLDSLYEMMRHPHTFLGLGDAGAHMGYIADMSYSTFALQFWPKRKAGGFSAQHIVHLLTGTVADHFGLKDRGRLKAGLRADVNVIDLDRLSLDRPRAVSDLPSGGRRYLQDAHGYEMVLTAGTPVLEKDQATGAKPGALLRAAV
jgi:N-acyl-D-aspartate/D-glutamate deacylase